jgi:hypothetical protein
MRISPRAQILVLAPTPMPLGWLESIETYTERDAFNVSGALNGTRRPRTGTSTTGATTSLGLS